MEDEPSALRFRLGLLVQGAQLLALGPEGHAVSLPSFVHVPDELLLNWDDGFNMTQQVHRAGLISDKAVLLVDSLEAAVSAAPVISDYRLAMEAIASSPEWDLIRKRANRLLVELGVDREPPTLSAQYIK